MADSFDILTGVDIVRAWKDEEYRFSLTEVQRAALPQSPADLDELTDEQLDEIAGGVLSSGSVGCNTNGCGNTVSCTKA